MKANQFYCVACRKKVMIDEDDICEVKLKNGRHALRAYCAKCDCHLTKFISNKSVSRMTSKFGKCKKSKKRSRKSAKKSKRKSRKSRRSRC
jgi:hypothetical protein